MPPPSTTFVCTRCNTESVRPVPALGDQPVMTFCQRCSDVTPHKAKQPEQQAGRSSSTGGPLPDQELWQQMQQRLRQYNIAEEELLRSSRETQDRLLQSLGFGADDQSRLRRLIDNAVNTRGGGAGGSAVGAGNSSNAGPSGPSNVGGYNNANQSGGPAASPARPGGWSNVGNASPAPNRGTSPLDGPSGVQGLTFEGDQVIARCSVYPHLPAEFWCCACNVLVSSRCHVQGIHKDHPFITLRLAAESHVRDVTAWNERCRTQLNVIASVMNNLRHAETLIGDAASKEVANLDSTVDTIINDLLRWKEQLKQDISAQTATQQASVNHALGHTEKLYTQYAEALSRAEPLMAHIPPVDGTDRGGEEWALRVLDLVSKLKHVNAEAIPMPKVSVPRVSAQATPSTHMELVKCVSMPLGVRLPDLLDPGYFNFPNPSVSARLPFTLVAPDDAAAKGLLLYNGRTLTRSQDVVPSHHLVLASQVFYSGSTSWEVHIDRLGAGTGRVLAGITVNGSDGEGVVWDGLRIVGPNDGESRTLDERYQWRPGTVLRFHLELDGPGCYLNCFFDRDGVARIPLPANGHGWVPAFSVFGPQDQVTVVPSTTTQVVGTLPGANRQHRDPALAAGDTITALERQSHIISSLQQQLNSVASRVDQDQFRMHDPQAEAFSSPPPRGNNQPQHYGGSPYQPQGQAPQQHQQQHQQPAYTGYRQGSASPSAAQGIGGYRSPSGPQQPNGATSGYQLPPGAAGAAAPTGSGYQPPAQGARQPPQGGQDQQQQGQRRSYPRDPMEAYTPELRRIIRYVEDSEGARR